MNFNVGEVVNLELSVNYPRALIVLSGKLTLVRLLTLTGQVSRDGIGVSNPFPVIRPTLPCYLILLIIRHVIIQLIHHISNSIH